MFRDCTDDGWGFDDLPDCEPIAIAPDYEPAGRPDQWRIKVKRYQKAVQRWIAAGFPTRTKEEVRRIYETICGLCRMSDNGRCRVCGCRVSGAGWPLMNKIKMGTERCPKRKW